MEESLLKLGLTQNETQILLEYYSHPLSNPASISRKLKIDKSSTYRAVDSLIKKGLLRFSGYKKGNLYSATNPSNLKVLFEQKEIELKNQKKNLDALIKELKTNKKTDRSTQIVVEEGLEALKQRISESLTSKEKVVRELFKDHEFFNNSEYISFVREHIKLRKEKKIKLLELQQGLKKFFPDLADKLKQKKYIKEIRVLSKNFNDNNSLRIWDDTINIISYGDNDEFIVVTIKDPFVATMMKNMFDFIWEKSEPLPPI